MILLCLISVFLTRPTHSATYTGSLPLHDNIINIIASFYGEELLIAVHGLKQFDRFFRFCLKRFDFLKILCNHGIYVFSSNIWRVKRNHERLSRVHAWTCGLMYSLFKLMLTKNVPRIVFLHGIFPGTFFAKLCFPFAVVLFVYKGLQITTIMFWDMWRCTFIRIMLTGCWSWCGVSMTQIQVKNYTLYY